MNVESGFSNIKVLLSSYTFNVFYPFFEMLTILKQSFYSDGGCDSSTALDFVIVIVLCKSRYYPFAWCGVRTVVYHFRISIDVCLFFEFSDSFAGERVFCLESDDIYEEESFELMKLDVWYEGTPTQFFREFIFKERNTVSDSIVTL